MFMMDFEQFVYMNLFPMVSNGFRNPKFSDMQYIIMVKLSWEIQCKSKHAEFLQTKNKPSATVPWNHQTKLSFFITHEKGLKRRSFFLNMNVVGINSVNNI